MAQFDVYTNSSERSRRSIPYLLDVQSDLLDMLTTRVVVPLVTAEAMGRPARHLNPSFAMEGRTVYLSTPELAGVPLQVLGDRVGSLADRRSDIIAALDFFCTGF